MCVGLLMDHQNSILWGGSWAAQSSSMPPQLSYKQIHFHSPSSSHFLSLSLSLFTPQQARQMAAPQPTVPGKACELKVIPSRSEELPASSRCGRGGGQPTCLPGSGTSGWGFVEWWACCRQPLLLPPRPAPCRKEKPASVQFFCSQMKQMSGCSSVWWTARLCPCAFVCYFEARGLGSGDALYLYHWMWWLVWATLAVGKVKVKSQNVAM